MTGKNSADIRLVVDAMELSYAKEHIDTFVDRVGRLRLHAARRASSRRTARPSSGVGMRDSTSDLLAANCDEFIYYEDLGAPAGAPALGDAVPRKKQARVQAAVRDDRGAAARERRRPCTPRSSRTR